MKDMAGEKLLCAGCYEWFARSDLRMNGKHPYCAHCYPSIRVVRADTGGEKRTHANMMRRRP